MPGLIKNTYTPRIRIQATAGKTHQRLKNAAKKVLFVVSFFLASCALIVFMPS
jgi:hypothetical protein